MNINNLATQNYKRFCGLSGSEYIASEFAIETILKLLKKSKINSVLEIGLGIGSISDSILKYAKINNIDIKYTGTEKNQFCLIALKSNVEDYYCLKIYSEINQIKNEKFDLIIIDGYDDSLKQIVSFCKNNTIIFIEGDRQFQTKTMLEIFPSSLYVNCITLKKNPVYAHENRSINSYIGGGQLIFIKPTFKQKIFWFKEKILTFIKRKIRNYRKKNLN